MAVKYYDPFRQLEELSREMSRMLSTSPVRSEDAGGVHASDWTPAVDIKEEEHRFVIRADVPGVEPKDIDVSMENGVLTIAGQRVQEEAQETDKYTRLERVRGTFLRRFTLPDTADEAKISAKTRDGVLEVAIPKRERAQPRRISVAS